MNEAHVSKILRPNMECGGLPPLCGGGLPPREGGTVAMES